MEFSRFRFHFHIKRTASTACSFRFRFHVLVINQRCSKILLFYIAAAILYFVKAILKLCAIDIFLNTVFEQLLDQAALQTVSDRALALWLKHPIGSR